jgi:hypothetical protein
MEINLDFEIGNTYKDKKNIKVVNRRKNDIVISSFDKSVKNRFLLFENKKEED